MVGRVSEWNYTRGTYASCDCRLLAHAHDGSRGKRVRPSVVLDKPADRLSAEPEGLHARWCPTAPEHARSSRRRSTRPHLAVERDGRARVRRGVKPAGRRTVPRLGHTSSGDRGLLPSGECRTRSTARLPDTSTHGRPTRMRLGDRHPRALATRECTAGMSSGLKPSTGPRSQSSG